MNKLLVVVGVLVLIAAVVANMYFSQRNQMVRLNETINAAWAQGHGLELLPAPELASPTVSCVRRGPLVAIGGDGQVTLGNIVVKARARKVRRLFRDQVLADAPAGITVTSALVVRARAFLAGPPLLRAATVPAESST